MPDRVVQIQAHEPAKEQVILKMLTEFALGGDGVEHLKQQGPQEVFGRDGGTTGLGVDPVEERGKAGKSLVGHLPDGPQRMIFGDALLQGTEEHKRRLPRLFSPHPNPSVSAFLQGKHYQTGPQIDRAGRQSQGCEEEFFSTLLGVEPPR